MTHPTDEQLQDYADGTLGSEVVAVVGAHLEECPSCRSCVDDFVALRKAASGFAFEALPPHSEWSRIEARILGSPGASPSRPPARRSPAFADARTHRVAPHRSLLRAASWLVAVGIGAGGLWFGFRNGPEAPVPEGLAPVPPAFFSSSELVSEAYAASIRELQLMLAEGPGRLEPETLGVIEDNLMIIEQAIERARAEVASDPGSPALVRSLNSLYNAKVRVLSAAVALSHDPRNPRSEEP